ncbi:MAG: hypothetical protein AAF152_07190 [Cyanobacteria bacterium P01_A01_bin.114]
METKQAYQKEAEARLEKLDAQMTEMRAKADQASAEVKAKYYEQLGMLAQRRETAKKQLDAFKASSEAAWENVKTGVDAAFSELQTAFDKAMSQFK